MVRNAIVKIANVLNFAVNHLLSLSNFCSSTNLEQGKA